MDSLDLLAAVLKGKVKKHLKNSENSDCKRKRSRPDTPYPEFVKKRKIITRSKSSLAATSLNWNVSNCENIKPDTSNPLCPTPIAYNSTSSEEETIIVEKNNYSFIPVAGGLSDEESDSSVDVVFNPRVAPNVNKCQIIRPKVVDYYPSNNTHEDSSEISDHNDSSELQNPVENDSPIKENGLPVEEEPIEHNLSQTGPKIRFSKVVKTFINENGCIVLLKHPLKLYFHGKLSLSVLHGAIEILGHILHHDNKEYEIYSPRGHAYLYFETKETNYNKNRENLRKNLQDLKMPTKQVKEYLYRLGENDCIIVIKNLNNNLTNYLSAHVAQYLFPKPIQCEKKIEKKLHCLFEINEPAWKTIQKNESWFSCLENTLCCLVKGFSCTMLCGGKSVGKSTLLRYMINSLLNEVEKVVCIDLDPGQSEFTIAGCISVTIVDRPIFGPSFTHLKTPVKSYFIGDVNILQCMDRYLSAASELIQYCHSNINKSYPWIVNCMGFTKSLGTDLTVKMIKLFSPTTVIQINSNIKNRNYTSTLNSDFVNNYMYSCPKIDNYNLITLDSSAEEKVEGGFEFEPRDLREMSILAYFSQIIEDGKEITSATPYSVKLSSIKLHDFSYSKENLLAVLNGNLVALCQENNETSFNCLGFGIVRGIDKDSEELFLLTPLPEDELEKVNSIVRGYINLPPSLYMATGRQGLVPYILLGTPQGTSSIPKRSYKNLKMLFRKE